MSSNSPCAACKFQRRKCTQECVFAPYFPPDNPQRFACVHRVFGASNVAKLLNELTASQRDEAVKSLAYEADARLRDPVYGCVGLVSVLQQRLRQIQTDLLNAKKELSTYVSPQAMQGLHGVPLAGSPMSSALLYPPYGGNAAQLLTATPQHNNGQLVMRDPQELIEAQQFAVAEAAQDQQQQQAMMRTYEQQQEFLRFNGGFDSSAGAITVPVGGGGGDVGSGGGFGNISTTSGGQAEMIPSLALGTFESVGSYQMQQQPQQHLGGHHHHVGHAHHPIDAQHLLSPQAQQSQQQQQSESEVS